jgi:predicted PurR-regulated permease PerM
MKQTRLELSENRTSQIALFFGTLAILYFARDILIPLAFALILAFLLTPAVTALEKLRIGRVPSVIVTVILMTAVLGAAAWVIANQLVDVAAQLPGYRENIRRKVEAIKLPSTGAFGKAAASLRDIGDELSRPTISGKPPGEREPVPVQVMPPGNNGLSEIWSVARPSLVRLASAGIVLIFTVFILIEKEDLRNRLLRLAGTGQINVMTEAIDDAAKRVSRYLLMQMLVNASFGLLTGVGLYFIGLPNPALWGVVAAIFRLVPYVGIMAGAGLPFALSLAVFDHWMQPLLVFVLFAVVELVTGNFVEPMLYGTHTGISSLALLVTTVFWAALWGPAGLILSTALTVCLVVLGRYLPQLSFLHIMLGDEPVLQPSAQLYQRLLAMNQQDAREVVDTYMKDAPLVDLYDSVLVPALTLAEQDRHRDAIDSTREEFLFLNINEMVAEFSEFADPTASLAGTGCRVLCVPAHDQADEIAAAMLAQLLEKQGCVALSFPSGPELEEMVGLMEPNPADLICISALQPYAFTPARTICKRLRSRFPSVPVIVGIWGFAGDKQKARARFDRTPPDQLCTSFAEVIQHVSHPAAVAETAAS